MKLLMAKFGQIWPFLIFLDLATLGGITSAGLTSAGGGDKLRLETKKQKKIINEGVLTSSGGLTSAGPTVSGISPTPPSPRNDHQGVTGAYPYLLPRALWALPKLVPPYPITIILVKLVPLPKFVLMFLPKSVLSKLFPCWIEFA